MKVVQSRKFGFTLIELLIVIAIIAILAAILFPVFAEARGKARQVSCLSNTKQIGTAQTMYLQDYDETYGFAWGGGATDHFIAGLQPYVGNSYTVMGSPSSAKGVWECLSADTIGTNQVSSAYSSNGNLMGVAYGWNPGGPGDEAPKDRSLSMADIQRPAEVITIAETARVALPDGTADTPTDMIRVGVAPGGGDGGDIDGPRDCSDTGMKACNWYALQSKCYDYTQYENTFQDPSITGWRFKQPAYRHARNGVGTGFANVLYADGHAKAVRHGRVTPRNWLPQLSDARASAADAYQASLACPGGKVSGNTIIPTN